MKKMAGIFLAVLAMFCLIFSTPATAQVGGEYQNSLTSDDFLVAVKCRHFGSDYITVADVVGLDGNINPVKLGENIFISEIIFLENRMVLLIGSDWNEGWGVMFLIDPDYPYYVAGEMRLRPMEFIVDHLVVPGGIYFSSVYVRNEELSSRLIKFWDFWSAPARITSFPLRNGWLTTYFGTVEGPNANPGVMMVNDEGRATTYRINGGSISRVRPPFKIDPRLYNINFWIGADNKVAYWGDMTIYREVVN
jgi:hypothetical protein